MNELFKNNLIALREKDRGLFETINADRECSLKYSAIQTKTSDYTLEITHYDNMTLRSEKFLLHSKYNPYNQERAFVKKNTERNKENIVVYGLGLGYHIEIMLEELLPTQKLYIIESNVELVRIAFMYRDFTRIITSKQVIFVLLSETYNEQMLLPILNNDKSTLIIHQPSIKAIPPKYQSLQSLFRNIQIMKWGVEKNQELLEENYTRNTALNHTNINCLFGKSEKLPIIIVSAGPSLNKNKHILHKAKDKALIFAVGSALKTLTLEGISPHLFCIIDPSPLTCKQIEGSENLSIPFVFLETASSYTVSKYSGPKYIVSNNIRSTEAKDGIIETGGSVATAILDMAIKFGGNPITFIGQDLAFTNYEHHAIGDMYGEEVNVRDLPNLKKVRGHNGQIFPTSSALLGFKNWIEGKIKKHPEVTFINATENGAIIEGCKHMNLRDVVTSHIRDEESIKLKLFLDRLEKLEA